MGGRAVDCDGLENRCGGNSTGGSNPSPSARNIGHPVVIPRDVLFCPGFRGFLSAIVPVYIRHRAQYCGQIFTTVKRNVRAGAPQAYVPYGANAYRIQDFYKRVWASYFFLNAIAKTVAPATNIIPDSNCPIVRPQLVKKPIWMSGARNCSHKIRNTAYSIANIPPSAPG